MVQRSLQARASGCAIALAFLAGCSGSPDGAAPPDAAQMSLDAGAADASPLPIAPPQAPTLPSSPNLSPCPQGWSEISAAGEPVTCEPWPSGRQSCDDGSALFPSEDGCRVVGPVCPSGEWADDLPQEQAPVLYVRAGASVEGDGSSTAPFATIGAAMSAASSGTVIALSKGTFDEAVQLKAGVTLWGACASQTRLTSSAPSTTLGILTAGRGGGARNLRIGGERVGVWANSRGNAIRLEHVIVDQATGIAVLAGNGAEVTGEDVVLRRTKPRPGSNTFGRGIDAEYGGKVQLTRVSVESNLDQGVNASGSGSAITLTDVAICDTRSRLSDGNMGRGVSATVGGQVTLRRAVLEGNHEVGIFAGGNARVELEDVIVRDTQPSSADGESGSGMVVEAASTAVLTRCLFSKNRAIALAAYDAGSRLTLTDTIVRETLCTARGLDGAGLVLRAGAAVEATRVLLTRNHSGGIGVYDATTALKLTDVSISATEQSSQGPEDGSGLQASGGASVQAQRLRVDANHRVGILLNDTGTLLEGEDVGVQGTLGMSDATGGSGLAVQSGAHASLTRATFEGNRAAGIQAAGSGAELSLTDLTIRATQSEARDGKFGRGLHLQEGARATVRRAVIEHNRDVALFATDPGTVLEVEDAVVEDTTRRACSESASCPDLGGSGAVAVWNASLKLSRFRLARHVQCGVQLGEGGVVDLELGEVVGNGLGACVLTPEFDIRRLEKQVRYADNGSDLSAEQVPLPDLKITPP